MVSIERQNTFVKNASLRSRFYRRFTDYSSATQFHGFGQIIESGNWLEQSVWLLILLTCFTLTIKDVTKTVQEYCEGGTTSTTTIKNSPNIVFPNTSLCVDIESDRLTFGELVDPQNVTDVQDFLRKNLDAFIVAGLINESLPAPVKNSRGSRIKVGLLNAARDLTTLLIMALTNAEFSLFSSAPNASTFKNLIEYPETALEMYNFYTAHNVTDWARLQRTTAQLLCSRILSKVIHRFSQDPEGAMHLQKFRSCQENAEYWLGRAPLRYRPVDKNKFCVRLHPGVFNFDVSTRVLFILYPLRLFRNATVTAKRHAFQHAPVITFNIDASSDAGIAESTSASCASLQLFNRHGKPAESARNILLQGEYTAYSGNGECEVGAVPLDCKAQARVDELEYLCKCRPHSWSNTLKSNTSLPFCSTMVFSSESEQKMCSEKVLARNMSWDGKDCMKNCKKTVIAHLEIELSSTYFNGVNIFERDDATLILFTANGFEHPVVDESPKVELADFFANLGGNLSLWLGGSFISLLHLFVFPLRVWLCGRANSAAEENAGESVSGAPQPRRTSYWQKKFDDIHLSDIKASAKRNRQRSSSV